MSDTFLKRGIRITYWDSEKRFFDRHKAMLEQELRQLVHLDVVNLDSLADPKSLPCDLLVVAAEQLQGDEFYPWLVKLKKQLAQQNKIKIPVLFFAQVAFAPIKDILIEATKDNWYFDIISPKNLDSLPIRVANLLRIHDHMHELQRHEDHYRALQKRVTEIEKKLLAHKKDGS